MGNIILIEETHKKTTLPLRRYLSHMRIKPKLPLARRPLSARRLSQLRVTRKLSLQTRHLYVHGTMNR